ncbi:MAG TPA: EcsC family protein [Coleofasciculaceae cyanobacterium]|jgi:uncharacterized protein (DUF697 family)
MDNRLQKPEPEELPLAKPSVKSADEKKRSLAPAIKSITGKVATLGGAIGQRASQTGGAASRLMTTLGNGMFRRSHRLAEQATEGAGQAAAFVEDSSVIRRLTKALKLDWFVGASSQVDLDKAEAFVHKLQQDHPNESASQIAHRIMVEKALYAGGVGLATSLVPGSAIALLAVDLATTTALQTEMLYQIATAYGLDLKDPARKGEVIAIFGLALGGSRAVRAGLVLVKNIPLAGALIGVSANAAILYTLGYAACRFYEAKLDPTVSETSDQTLEALKQKSDSYLEIAIAQQTIMDQILAHMILASYPDKTWTDILPNLQSLGLHPSSLKAIADNLKSPQPLGALLQQLNEDFNVLTLSRCYAIAQLDGSLSPQETEVLEAISKKLSVDLDTVKARIEAARIAQPPVV